MKIKMIIFILPRFAFFFQIFNIFYCHSYIIHMDILLPKISQQLLDLELWKLYQFCLFSESATTSDGYCRGYVSYAYFLLYFFSMFERQYLLKYNIVMWLYVRHNFKHYKISQLTTYL